MELEDKLRNVKDKVYERLKQGEMESLEYFDFVENGLVEQGLMEEDDSALLNPLTNKVLPKFEEKLSIVSVIGFLNNYYKIKDVDLSDKAKEDVEVYKKMEVSTKNYLTEKIGSKEIGMKEFMNLVEDYVLSEGNFPEEMLDYKKGMIATKVVGSFYHSFNIVKDPEMIGNCRDDKLEDALDKF